PGFYDLANGDRDGCEYACTPTNNGVEVCDLVDNDCDGQIDEGFDVDGDGFSVCRGDCNDANAAVKPGAAESCNGVDDNCDGRVDEGFDGDQDGFTSCGTLSGGGIDPTRADCDDADKQVFPGATERCNGKDDNCNGQTDEGFGQLSCGVGACANTVARCQGGQLQTCTPKAPVAESCANVGVDDDCDGDATELADGVHAGDACTTGQHGICAPGTRACSNGALVCNRTNSPATIESCGNGLDDNCDGRVDENPPCTCALGSTQPCYEAGAGCTYNATTRSYACVGTCTAGVQTCVSVSGLPQWGACSGAVYPVAESCANQGQDNDCDGDATELIDGVRANAACSTGLQGECAAGRRTCSSGSVICAQQTQASAEVCDGKDNDCNGAADDGIGTATCGVGACQRTVERCVNGQTQTCTPGQPTAEVCNGADDDCNGQTDDGLGTATCGVGECLRTVQRCVNGQTQSCVPGTPTTEICDGKDNNCNGTNDDVTPATLTCGVGACARTVPACSNNANNTCTPGTPGVESCNGVDDDCNGAVDDNIAPASCSTGKQGICAAGLTACNNGLSSCQQQSQPQTEICGNNLDDDCNGVVDNGCGCVDVDNDGVTTCQGDCNDNDGAIKPGAIERCDGKDNDCDGAIDEGFDADGDGYTTCGTVPSGGIDPRRIDCNDNDATMNPGKTCDCAANCTTSPPSGISTGQGDGKDNNCNGVVDETCGCSTADSDRDGFSQCTGDCNDSDKTVYPGAPELCDGKNNDCNAQTIENCDVGQPCGFSTNDDKCKDRLICASDVATGRQTCGSFCNFSLVGGGVGDGCRAGESCAATLVAASNNHLCTASGTTGTKGAGEICTANGECKSNSCYCDRWHNNGKDCLVTRYCADLCGNDKNYCSSSSTCVIRFVPDSDPRYQYYTGFCYSNALNYEGTKTTGQNCVKGLTPPDCRWGDESCVNGKCAEPCCRNEDCPGTHFCNPAGITRRVGQYSGGLYAATGMPVCLPRTSSGTRVAGAACNSNADCLSQFCEKSVLGGKCVDTCCSDASCKNGTTCEFLLVKKPDGDAQNMRVCVHKPLPPRQTGQADLVWP
ncbi:MAG: putative metal-binding motif-containing protein, partial [Myxococcales bacterium]